MPRSKSDWIWKMPVDERRNTLAVYIARDDGNLKKTAHTIGISRWHLYRLVYQLNLWPVVNAARLEKKRRRDAERTIAKRTQRESKWTRRI